MYEEYLRAYKQYSSKYGADTAIFYQVGKFYEFYDWVLPETGETNTSMKRFIDILNTKITIRKGDGPNKTDGFFAGVPEQSLHKYASLLTRAGWTVVVYDQVKDAKGAVKSREVSRILTPGTHVEAATDGAVYIGGVWLETGTWGSTTSPRFATLAMDLTTGKSLTYEGQTSGKANSWTADDIFHFFQVFLPKECVVWWRGDPMDMPTPEFLQRQFGLPGIRVHILSGNGQGGFEKPNVREEFLQRTLSVRSLLPVSQLLGTEVRLCTERLLCSMIQRIREQYPSGFKYIPMPQQWIPENHLSLGNQALFQLNMVAPILEDSVLGLFQKTYTVFGRRAMRNRLLYPKADPVELAHRYEQIQSIIEMDKAVLHIYLRHIEDLPRLHKRLSEGEITSSEILLLDKSYISAKRLAVVLSGGALSKSSDWSFETIEEAMSGVFSIERAEKASDDAFCFVEGSAPEVDRIEADLVRYSESLKTCLETIRKWAGLGADVLRLEFREILGPTITGTKGTMINLSQAIRSKELPYPGMVVQQKKSSSHLEVPFLETTFQKILRKRSELQEAVRSALPKLCSEITNTCLDTWIKLEEWIANVDVTTTIAEVSVKRGFIRPEIQGAESAFVAVEGLRHPLIEAAKTRVEYVKHAVSLGNGSSRGWLIYGMNASGKSSLMKAVGIAIILAQAGCYVPATSFRFSPFQTLYTRILNTDNLWAGLSSFAVEMTELREILQGAGPGSLVLGDEVCSGTESVSATAIVAATLAFLHKKGAKFMFATHLHSLLEIRSLKDLSWLSVWHLKVRYDPVADRLIYERTLTPGAGSSLYGLEVARAMNIPEEVLSMAHSLRRELLGTATELEAPGSSWNSVVQRRVCEQCGSDFVANLEVHHIRERTEADQRGVFDDGAQMNHLRNLVVLCDLCHDKVHSGAVVIGPMVQSSDGPMRLSSASDTTTKRSLKSSKWTEEQHEMIQEYLKTYPNVPPKRALFDLGEQGIHISLVSLRKFRSNA